MRDKLPKLYDTACIHKCNSHKFEYVPLTSKHKIQFNVNFDLSSLGQVFIDQKIQKIDFIDLSKFGSSKSYFLRLFQDFMLKQTFNTH